MFPAVAMKLLDFVGIYGTILARWARSSSWTSDLADRWG